MPLISHSRFFVLLLQKRFINDFKVNICANTQVPLRFSTPDACSEFPCFAMFKLMRQPTPALHYKNAKKLPTGNGPEDIALDTLTSKSARLLVSCSSRRKNNTEAGEIYALDLSTEQALKLTRTGEPSGLPAFNPHGIHLQMVEGEAHLFVVNHELDRKDDLKHTVFKYRVFENRLEFAKLYTSGLFSNLNDVFALSDGAFIVSNPGGDFANILKLKRAKVLYCTKEGKCEVAADKLGYANGVAIRNDTAYVATTRQHKLFAYDFDGMGNFSNRRMIAKLPGLDNIEFYGNELLVPSHPKAMAFVKHFKNPEKISPSVVYAVNPQTGKHRLLYSDDGSEISAASTAIIYDGYMYIAQVFEPFLLKVELE